MTSAQQLATSVVKSLVERGATEAVLCPGSRSAPLAFALAAEPRIRLHTRLDERTAGFLALGLAKASRRPVPVVCTSGTATANLHPAVLEAAHAGVRLVAVTADRPARLRGTDANQTTDQVGLYGDAAPTFDLDAPLDHLLPWRDHPLHLNVQLDEPLVPEVVGVSERKRRDTPSPTDSITRKPGEDVSVRKRPYPWQTDADPVRLTLGPRTVVIAGDDAGPPARQLAELAGWPLLAEPSSGARTGGHALRTYRLLLTTALAEEVERVVVLGHPTLSRPVQRLLARPGVAVVDVPPRGRWPRRPYAVAAQHAAVTVEAADDPSWLARWCEADQTLAARIDDAVASRPGLTPHEVAAAVNAANPPGGLLVVGASNPIRDLDLMAAPHPVGERRMVLANRGLAGIDGTLSTAIGAALARDRSTRALAYVGDVTFLHDLTGLILGPDEPRPDLTVVVANDDGGSVFATLEQGAPAYADSFERLFATPHGVDLAALCAATRTPHRAVRTRLELEQALADPRNGIEVVEAVVPRHDRRELEEHLRALTG